MSYLSLGSYALNSKCLKRWQSLLGQCQRTLAEQQIMVGNPGTILADVNTMLEFVGPDGIVSKSGNATLPAERLPELNARAGHPIKLILKRALLRDYPNLAGIFVLLRVMDLFQMRGKRLMVCSTALESWRALNPTEQYFALLEALLFHAHSSVLGDEATREEGPQSFEDAVSFLAQLTERWRNFECYDSASILGPQG